MTLKRAGIVLDALGMRSELIAKLSQAVAGGMALDEATARAYSTSNWIN